MTNNHPNRNWRRRMIDAADEVSAQLREKRWQEPGDKYLAQLMAREAYMLGYRAGREDARR